MRCQDDDETLPKVQPTIDEATALSAETQATTCIINYLQFQTRTKFSFKILTKLQSSVVNQNLLRSYASRLRFLLRKPHVDSDFTQII